MSPEGLTAADHASKAKRMPLTRSDFENISERDFQTLVENEVGEGITLDYKRELYGASDSDKKEFLKDVSSFANTAGGHIVIGIAEDGGLPTEIVGVDADLDAEKLRLENLLRDRLEPRIVGVRITSVALNKGQRALVIRIPKSWNPPHAVLQNKSRLIFARNSAGAHEASVDEMRTMFTAGANLLEQARELQRKRMEIIHSGNGPFSNFNGEGGRMVLHIIPFSAFGSELLLEPTRVHGQDLPPICCSGYNHGYNIDGYWTSSGDGARPAGYVQVFRNGVVESAAGDVRTTNHPRGNVLFAESVENRVANGVRNYMTALAHAEVSPPMLVMLAGVRMHGTIVIGNPNATMVDAHPLPADVQFPSITLDDFGELEDYRRALKPIFDAVWNSAGYPQSQSFDKNGNWAPRGR
jgi:Schlafen, AlbA_2